MCGSKHDLGGPIHYQTLNSSSKFEQLSHTLMHKCTRFSASRRAHRFLMYARAGSTRYHNSLPHKIISYRTSYYIDGIKHPILAGSFNLSQSKESNTQIHTIPYYIAEQYLVLIHSWGVYAILLLC